MNNQHYRPWSTKANNKRHYNIYYFALPFKTIYKSTPKQIIIQRWWKSHGHALYSMVVLLRNKSMLLVHRLSQYQPGSQLYMHYTVMHFLVPCTGKRQRLMNRRLQWLPLMVMMVACWLMADGWWPMTCWWLMSLSKQLGATVTRC